MEKDGKKIWWIFFFLGMGTLLPWNFFITPYAYWMEKLKLTTETNETVTHQKYQAFWGSTMALATMGTNFIMCFITTLLMPRISRNTRFLVPVVGIGICFAIAAFYTTLDLPAGSFFGQTMINVVTITVFCAILQASLFGHGAEIGNVMSAIMSGQGVGGIMASLTDIFTKLVYDDGAAMLFFVIPAVFMVFTGLAYFYLQKLPEYQDKLALSNPLDQPEKVELNQNEEKEHFLESSDHSIITVVTDYSNGIAIYMFCVFFTFTVTLGLFPAVLQNLKPVNYNVTAVDAGLEEKSEFYDKFFLTICVFFMFNLTDTIGRMSSEYVLRPGSPLNFIKPNQPKRLLVLVLSRVVLLILFPMCNIFPELEGRHIFFKSDVVFVLLMIIFGISNGLFSSIAMSYAPQCAPEAARERIGGYMGTVLVAGLFAGASLSFVLVPMAQHF